MSTRKNVDPNEFEGHVKIKGFNSKESLINKIDTYLEKYKTDKNEILYDIEKESSNFIILNFHKNTELANYVIRKLKLLQLDNSAYSKLNCHLTIKVINPNQVEQDKKKEEEKKEEGKKEEKSPSKKNKNKIKNYNDDIYNLDTKNNPILNKLISKSSNFTKRNINKYLSPENNKMKIYESIFFGGPYVNRTDLERKEAKKNKALWLNQKGFNQYISKETILKNSHMIKNILYTEPIQKQSYNFREIKKTKWVGKNDFFA